MKVLQQPLEYEKLHEAPKVKVSDFSEPQKNSSQPSSVREITKGPLVKKIHLDTSGREVDVQTVAWRLA